MPISISVRGLARVTLSKKERERERGREREKERERERERERGRERGRERKRKREHWWDIGRSTTPIRREEDNRMQRKLYAYHERMKIHANERKQALLQQQTRRLIGRLPFAGRHAGTRASAIITLDIRARQLPERSAR